MGTAQSVWFDLTRTGPIALRILRARLERRVFWRVLGALLRRSLFDDPLRSIPIDAAAPERDRASRRQLRPVILLHDALRGSGSVDATVALSIVHDVVAAAGAAFIAANLPPITPEMWDSMSPEHRRQTTEHVMAKFPNADAKPHLVDDSTLAFDVHACRFADYTRRIGRSELAPLFCAADRVFFDDPASPLALQRTTTLAENGSRCDFRLHWRVPTDTAPT